VKNGTVNYLAVQDFASLPAYLNCAPAAEVATFAYRFYSDCTNVTVAPIGDPCLVRAQLFGFVSPVQIGNITFTRIPCDASVAAHANVGGCAPPVPGIVYGSYAAVDAVSAPSNRFSLTIASDGSYVEVNSRAVYFGQASFVGNSTTRFKISEFLSQEPGLGCDASAVGVYEWAPTSPEDVNCTASLAALSVTPDPCIARYERLDGVVLHPFDVCVAEHHRYVERAMQGVISENARSVAAAAEAKWQAQLAAEASAAPAVVTHAPQQPIELHLEHDTPQRRHGRHRRDHRQHASESSSSSTTSSLVYLDDDDNTGDDDDDGKLPFKK